MNVDDLKLTDKRKLICQRLELNSIEDILRYYPFKYENNSLTHYKDFVIDGRVMFECVMCSSPSTFRYRKGMSKTAFKVIYEQEELTISIFNRPWIKNNGKKLVVVGKYNGNNKVTASNCYTKDINELIGIQPLYSLKEGINQNEIRKLIDIALNKCNESIIDYLPNDLKESHRLISLKEALFSIHHPNNEEALKLSLARLKYDEFLKFYLSLNIIKSFNNNNNKNKKSFNEDKVNEFIKNLSFELTPDQEKAVNDILFDLKSNKPMYRLVQGDVGCGKTVVSMIALYANMLSGFQGVIMAPTEILARQHYDSFKTVFGSLARIGLLCRDLDDTKTVKEKIKNNEIDIVVGTHALFQEDVIFNNLGLVITDEQQRFGVKQRKALKDKGDNVDFLLMSATPIPRTLANSLYGDMDISTIETLPNDRKGCDTFMINKNSIVDIIPDLKKKLDEGRQIYIIASAIESSENFNGKDASGLYNSLIDVFKPYNLSLLHGRLSSDEKTSIMNDFNENKIQILVSTTVVEVGVNVKNATVMVVYDAERFGLSQLHQLRGRIQRGNIKGTCYLLTDSKDELAISRLKVLCDTNDGFKISSEDLRLRGPGDILGTRQSGLPTFKLGNIFEDTRIIDGAKRDANTIISNLNNPNYKAYYDYVANLAKDFDYD